MMPHNSIQQLLKAKHFPPDRAVEMLRPIISMLRNLEPHTLEAHEASFALSALVEGLRSDSELSETLWDLAFTRLGAFENSYA